MTHHTYPLKATDSCHVTLDSTGRLILEKSINGAEMTVLLRLNCRARSRRKQGHVKIHGPKQQWVQYIEAGEEGERWFNLTGIVSLADCRLEAVDCSLAKEGELFAFQNPDLTDGPILILSPHPDDAELAAYGLYSDHAEQSWIITVSAGEKLKTLKKQYIDGLDTSLDEAVLRKGDIRAWNSICTPRLAGVNPHRLFCLGYFNDMLSTLVAEPNQIHPHPSVPSLTPSRFRRWNPHRLPNDANSQHSGARLIADIKSLLELIRPTTVLVTHPELDPHRDHIAVAEALALAMQFSGFIPDRVLLYANHLRHGKHFPYGPEHSRATLPPWFDDQSRLGDWQCYSHPLDMERQRQKVVAFDSMHDLQANLRLEKRLKRWWGQVVRHNGFHYYGTHDYFQTHIKADEVFCWVTGDAFLRGMTEQS